MADTTLHDLVLKRLEDETQPEDKWSALILAALDGPNELARLCSEAPEPPQPGTPAGHEPQAALIRWICILPFQPPGSRNEATYPRDTLSSFRQLILESIPYRPRGVTWPASGGEQWTRGGCGTIASDGAP
jgi:hypothetical protein